MDRLMLVGTSSSGTARRKDVRFWMRCLKALRTSRLVEGSCSIRKSRSAPGKISIRESRILGATASIRNSLERLRVISRIALSLTSGRTALAIVLEREASSVRKSGFSPPALSVTSMTSAAAAESIVLGARLGIVDELDVADVDPVVVLQRMLDTTLQLGVVDKRLVPRVEIDHDEIRPDFADLGMPPADPVGSQNDVAFRQATDHRHVRFQINHRAGEISGQVLQNRHWTVLRSYMVFATVGR